MNPHTTHPALLLLLILAVAAPPHAVGSQHAPRAAPDDAAQIQALVDRAAPGDTVRVRPGTYAGRLIISRPITLVGDGRPVIDAGGRGTVVEIRAPGVTLRGLTLRGSGAKVELEEAGVRVLAERAVIEDNVIEDCLFGIDLRAAPGSTIRSNLIVGKDLDLGRRGDAIRLWESHDSVLENNVVRRGRDIVLWYSERLTLRHNTATHSRYGFHAMYSHDMLLEDNVIQDNSVGVYIMYSSHITLRRNTLQGSRGPSGYGLGLKDADAITVEDNLFAGNRVGVYADNTPSSMDSFGVFTRNIFAYNDQGMALSPNVRNNELWDNAFLDNEEQIALLGRGVLDGNRFSREGRGNYWSDYGGFDRGGDGVGDTPYVSADLFESLMDREPRLRLFLHSPAEQAVTLAARILPQYMPEPKFTDPTPLVELPATHAPLGARRGDGAIGVLGAGLALAGLALAGAPRLGGRRRAHTRPSEGAPR